MRCIVLCVGGVACLDAQAFVPGMGGRGLFGSARILGGCIWMVLGGRLGPVPQVRRFLCVKRSCMACFRRSESRLSGAAALDSLPVAIIMRLQPGACTYSPICRCAHGPIAPPRSTRRAESAVANCIEITGQPRSRASNQAARVFIRERLVRSRLAAVRPSAREGTQARRKVPNLTPTRVFPITCISANSTLLPAPDSLSPPRVLVQRHPGLESVSRDLLASRCAGRAAPFTMGS
ncbi:uncharacterized protein CC84DRAFT_1236782 [Paraphaeosphaeria sporulosa]|uniref:Uncharacterized protein n=1 Tax=Paraphaeosphaeria sporulosa TaxID=1460663 RepID=A0A177CTP6_9PLEO|nr:uncharacterized protein CC84DRAFT_1236782 [Paraphaeosphaeria sporulosa]OAG10270.1 hypothetical protein CC84DRAFT_1236782 [Paraphaeosphaeria sporulosa]